MGVDHYENFPVASLLCPRPLRPAVRAIYGFARTADDLADEGSATAAERLQALAAYRVDLEAVLAGRPASPRWPAVFEALAAECRRFELPGAPLQALLDAFEQDVRNPVYTTRLQLLGYCSRSANPVGRLVLHLYAIDDPASLRQSDAICSALQLINFWQDLGKDLSRGRCYVPLEDLAAHGMTRTDLEAGVDTPASRRLVADLCAWASSLMHEGAPLALRVPGRAGWELRGVVQGGLRVLHHIARQGHAVLGHRPRLTAADLPPMAWRALRMQPPGPAGPAASPPGRRV